MNQWCINGSLCPKDSYRQLEEIITSTDTAQVIDNYKIPWKYNHTIFTMFVETCHQPKKKNDLGPCILKKMRPVFFQSSYCTCTRLVWSWNLPHSYKTICGLLIFKHQLNYQPLELCNSEKWKFDQIVYVIIWVSRQAKKNWPVGFQMFDCQII